MKKSILILSFLAFSQNLFATTGNGIVTDVTLRAQDNVLAIKVSSPGVQPACVSWVHTYAFDLDSNPVVGASFMGMLTSAMKNGESVKISGTGNCLAGTNAEEIREINVGPWGN